MKPTIRNKLYFGFGAVLLTVAVGAATGTYGVYSTRNRARLNALGLSLQMRNLEARRAETEFRLQIKTLGVAEAKKQYITEARSALDEVQRLARQATAEGGGFESITPAAKVYATELEREVAALERRGHVNTGAEGAFRDAVHAIEADITARHDDKAEIAMLSLRRSEKDYLLRGGAEYIDLVHQKLERLIELINSPASGAERARMLENAERYRASFDALVEAEQEVSIREKICKSASDRVAEFAQAESSRLMENMMFYDAVVLNLVVALSALGLAAGYWWSRRLIGQILAPINHLKEVAENVSLGNLEIAVRRFSEDEIGDLSDSFARMVTAVKFFRMEAEDAELSQQNGVRP